VVEIIPVIIGSAPVLSIIKNFKLLLEYLFLQSTHTFTCVKSLATPATCVPSSFWSLKWKRCSTIAVEHSCQGPFLNFDSTAEEDNYELYLVAPQTPKQWPCLF